MQPAPVPSASYAIPPAHLLLALAVVAIWGTNFVVIHVGLAHLPPLLFATLRFCFVLLPAIFLVRRPAVPWRYLAGYGLFIGAGQFALMNFAMSRYISPGLASLVLQAQMFFTIGLAMLFAGERLRAYQLVALPLAIAGILVILSHTDGTTTPLGLALVLGAAASWGIGNHIARASGVKDMLPFVIWSALFSMPPLLLATLIVDGPAKIVVSLGSASLVTWAAVLWQSVANTLFGYTAWGWLLARHPAATITPTALLVPIFGMSASALLLGEAMPPWKLIAAALVIGGLSINVLWPMIATRLRRAATV